MTTKYTKSKDSKVAGPNPIGPGFRTPSGFRANFFNPAKSFNQKGFTPTKFRVTQHKGG